MIQAGDPIEPSNFIGNPAPFFSIEHTVGTTHSLTTVANQKVVVTAKGRVVGSSVDMSVTLLYDGVAKDSVVVRTGNNNYGASWCLTYVETPGAATEDITVTSSNSLSEVKITVQKLLIG